VGLVGLGVVWWFWVGIAGLGSVGGILWVFSVLGYFGCFERYLVFSGIPEWLVGIIRVLFVLCGYSRFC